MKINRLSDYFCLCLLAGTLLVLRDTASASSLFNDKEPNNKSRAVRHAFLEEAASSPSQGLFLPHLHHLKRTRHGLYRPVRQPLHQEHPNSNARLTRIKHYVLRRLQNKHGQRDVGLNGIIPDLLPEADNHSVRVLDTAWYGNSYIPYRYRCQTSGHCSPRPALAQPTEPPIASPRPRIPIPPCVHLRWNYELPFSELPNLVFSFLAFDMVSGQTLTEKSRFLSILLEAGANAYMSANSSADVFEVPDAIDTTSCSIKRSVEPLIDSLHQLLNLYTSRDQRLLLTLVQATKACLDKSEMPFPQELLPCLDYSFGQEQLLDLLQPRSVFGNRELCRYSVH
ncbi:hypothetical protein RvY_13911-2 [Ramazzottius varieornatus]|uniref:Uncharacterized protein n=1 Tax=Ramazzottius varieornatus TaxID=947166 RepID=A0A1D1VUP3_RAMVA|nr:hypothetical protein RvY_13911-2 [Ramazzottius varieornatus]